MQQSMQRFLDLNISRESELQNVVTLAAETCQTQIAILVFSENGKSAYSFKAGTIADSITAEHPFECIELIPNQITVIPDTLLDPCSAQVSLVTGAPHIRFYAGTPLITHDNKNIGTLYVLGQEAKDLSPRRRGMLQILARQAINIIEFDMSLHILKHQFAEAKSSEIKLRSFFESSRSGHLLIGRNLEVLTFNKAFFEIVRTLIGISVTVGMKATECIPATYLNDFMLNCQAALTGASVQHERLLEFSEVPSIWTRLTYNPALDSEGNIIGVSFNTTDITNRKKSEEKILAQNEALRKIAYMQSHNLRKPVASILGLMHLLKLDGVTNHDEVLYLMDLTVQELDETIRNIVNLTEAQSDEQSINDIQLGISRLLS